jgi:hypothetical protein
MRGVPATLRVKRASIERTRCIIMCAMSYARRGHDACVTGITRGATHARAYLCACGDYSPRTAQANASGTPDSCRTTGDQPSTSKARREP